MYAHRALANVAWISIAPVKGMRMQQLSEVEMSREGAVSDREFFLLDESDAMVSVTRIGPLVEIVPDFRPDPDDPALTLTFPDGSMVGESR